MNSLEQKDLAPVAKEFVAGNRTQALALLVGVTTTLLTSSPIFGGAVAGIVPRLANLVANDAMQRVEAAAERWDSEQAFLKELRSAVSSSMRDDFGPLFKEIEELKERGDEHFLQTLKFTERNVVQPLEEVRQILGEVRDGSKSTHIGDPRDPHMAKQEAQERPLRLTSYGRLPGSLHFDAEALEEERTQWRDQYEGKLRGLRDALLATRSPILDIEPKCVLGAALFVGSIFHAATGLQLRIRQHNQTTGQTEQWYRTVGRAVEAFRFEHAVRSVGAGGQPTELQVRVSLTHHVAPEADSWTNDQQVSAVALDLEAPEIGSTSVRSGEDAYAAAQTVRKHILQLRREQHGYQSLPLRFFFAGPVAVALFIGAELNAMGRVYLMDRRKTEGKYVQSFDIWPGE